MVKQIDFTFLMTCTERCTTSLWSPGETGDSTYVCKQDSEKKGVIVIRIQTCWCNSNNENSLRFIVNSISVNSKAIRVIENGKDKWCYWNFPKYIHAHSEYSEYQYHILMAWTQVFYPILSGQYLTQERSDFSKVKYKSMCQGLHYLKMLC
jgi:hypothetical protein